MEVIYRSHVKRRCLEHGLVLEAAGVRFRIDREPGEHLLLVADADVDRARAELAAYASENSGWPGKMPIPHHYSGGWLGVYGFVAVLLLVDVFADYRLFTADWYGVGRTHAGHIRDGQWWRAITALTLHADLPHLVGNIVVGSLFGFLAARLLGGGLAWFSILLTGAVGNVINAWIENTRHTSVGASTAVFAALGIVSAYVWTRRRHMKAAALVRWSPLVGGVVLLGYFGVGGARTDVSAHFAGFLSGLLLGGLLGKLGDRAPLGKRSQAVFGALAVAILTIAWWAAIKTGAT